MDMGSDRGLMGRKFTVRREEAVRTVWSSATVVVVLMRVASIIEASRVSGSALWVVRAVRRGKRFARQGGALERRAADWWSDWSRRQVASSRAGKRFVDVTRFHRGSGRDLAFFRRRSCALTLTDPSRSKRSTWTRRSERLSRVFGGRSGPAHTPHLTSPHLSAPIFTAPGWHQARCTRPRR